MPSSNSGAKPLALTIGDPAGIGPEITHKAWQALRSSDGKSGECFFVIADPMFYPNAALIDRPEQAASKFANALPLLPIDCPRIIPGQPDTSAAGTIIKSIEMAVKFAQIGQVGGVVTNPIAKEVLYKAGFTHPGHTEFLAALTNTPLPVMMLSAQGLRVALVTIHISLQDVPDAVTGDLIMSTAKILHAALRRDFGIKKPRIAMTGLNPHAGEGGALGRAEIEILNPAAKKLRGDGIDISDARPADTLFHAEAREGYDAVLAMYHDQGLIPVKTLDFHGGVNTTLGLPIIRTSPDHGTAFDLSGSGQARPDSLIAAIKAARAMAACRAIS